MSNDLPLPAEHVAGDTLELRVTVRDSDTENEYKDLVGGEAEFTILHVNREEPIVDDGGISVEIGSDPGGPVVVTIGGGVTAGLSGTVRPRLRVVDTAGRRVTYSGELDVVDLG